MGRRRESLEDLLRRVLREELADALGTSQPQPPPSREPVLFDYIYSLCDPRTGDPCYIGRSNDPENRYAQHIYQAIYQERFERTPKEEWIRDLARIGLRPDLRVLEKVLRDTAWEDERRWIRQAIADGHDLTNVGYPA